MESECVMLQKGMLLFDTAQYDGILKKLHMFNSSLATDEVVPCFITFYLIGMQELNDFGDANHILTGKERVRPQWIRAFTTAYNYFNSAGWVSLPYQQFERWGYYTSVEDASFMASIYVVPRFPSLLHCYDNFFCLIIKYFMVHQNITISIRKLNQSWQWLTTRVSMNRSWYFKNHSFASLRHNVICTICTFWERWVLSRYIENVWEWLEWVFYMWIVGVL